AANGAFLDIECRLAEFVADIFQCRGARVTDDREHRFERGVQAHVFARAISLQKLAIRIELNGQQVRNLQNTGAFAEILADALLFGKGIGHCVYPRAVSRLNRGACAPSSKVSKLQLPAERPAAGNGTRCHADGVPATARAHAKAVASKSSFPAFRRIYPDKKQEKAGGFR